jgi:hypothetical protein
MALLVLISYLVVLTAVTAWGTTRSSGAAVVTPSTTDKQRPKICPDARRAVRYYQRHYAEWRAKMGAEVSVAGRTPGSCPRYLAAVWKRKAYAARVAYQRWHEYHYAWWKWMPAKHQRVARCETGYQGGTGPGGSRWDWDSGRYVSAFGIYRPAYDDDAHRAGNLGWDETLRRLRRYPTPREQMQAVDAHRDAHGGWSGWGCRGA